MDAFFIEFLPTLNCNQSCVYCDLESNRRNIQAPIEMDLDYFKMCINALGKHTNNMFVEICGGEPGLISNLAEAMIFLKDHKSVMKTQLMSNGLVRKDQPHLLELTDSYNEHLIRTIKDKEVVKFYDLEFDDYANTKYVIVLDESTTDSLINNFNHYYEFFNEDKFWLKMFVERSSTNNHKTKIIELFKMIDSDYARHSIKQLTENNQFARRACSMFPYLPVINLETKKIIHCAYHDFTNNVEYEVTEDNLKLLINKRLFLNHAMPSYCDDCYLYYRNSAFLMKRNKSNLKI